MAGLMPERGTVDFSVDEFTGAVGDVAVVLPLVVALAALTELSLAVMLVWFGIFQIVFGLYYGLPISVEPMKVLAALAIAGALTAGELALAGIALGVVLILIGVPRLLDRVGFLFGDPVVRGVQLAVAFVLLEIAIDLSLDDITLAVIGFAIAMLVIVIGYHTLSAIAVIAVGGGVALWVAGIPSPELPAMGLAYTSDDLTVSLAVADATLAQLAMTIGNAALATSVLLGDLYERDISADRLSTGMGVMNIVSVPLGALPMCHGSGGVAGKYAFGARTGGSNIYLGIGYLLAAIFAVGLVVAFPLSMLGVILVIVSLQLAMVSLKTEQLWLTIGVGVLGVLTNIGLAFLVGVGIYLIWRWYGATDT